MLYTPVLFLIFNRPDTTAQVFEAIRQAKPKQLFIAADGPRAGWPEDIQKCRQARDVVLQVDWDCNVKTLYREKNLGCKYAVSAAIDWFFENVEEGIILEDDTLPENSFFQFCESMLDKYRGESQVMMVGGTNYFFGKFGYLNSYYFSNLGIVWGWATWRRTWKLYSLTFEGYDEFIQNNIIEKRYKNFKISRYFRELIVATRAHKIQTWDIQLVYLLCKHNGLSIIPFRNLIQNIGYHGTHTSGIDSKHPFFEMQINPIQIAKLIHPAKIEADLRYDQVNYKYIIKYGLTSNFINRIRMLFPAPLRKLYRKIKKIII